MLRKEITAGRDLRPVVSIEYGATHRRMEVAKFDNVGVTLEGVVETIVNVRQSLVGPRHEVGSPRVTGPARLFERLR